MSASATAPLSEPAIDLTPGVVALPAAGAHTATCTTCGERAAEHEQRAAVHVPAWFYVAGALFFGLAYYGAVERLWLDNPLAAANHQYRRDPLHHAVLVVAPALIPLVYLVLLSVLGTIFFRARGLSLSVCRPCRGRARVVRAGFALLGPLLVVAAAVALHAAATVELPVLAVGVVLLPFAFARSVLRRLLPGREGAVALCRQRDGDWRVLVPAAAETVLRREASTTLRTEGPSARAYKLGWLAPVAVVVFAQLVLVSGVRRWACPYGSAPMTWQERGERHTGCMTPAGDRHGRWRGKKGGVPLWEALYRFDRLLPGTKRSLRPTGPAR